MTLKRDLVKYVRDKAKSKYNKGTECYICGSQENLDFHQFYGLTELLEVWLKKNKITTKCPIMRMFTKVTQYPLQYRVTKRALFNDNVCIFNDKQITSDQITITMTV